MPFPASARRHFLGGLIALLTLAFAGVPGQALAADIPVVPATFEIAFAAAQAGDTLLLASGNYGHFEGAMKSGEVTIKAQNGSTPVMAFSFNPASNITLDGLKITDGYVSGSRTKNITVRNSDFNRARFLARGGEGDLVNANVLLENNRHTNVDVCSGCYAGRVQIAERTEEPTGITIRNSLFSGGNADGIQNGGNGTVIEGNTFRDLRQPDDGSIAHTGSIQLYGSKNTKIRRNFFYNVSVAVGAYDRVDHEVIEDNVVVLDGQNAWVSEYLSDVNSIIRHNTFAAFNSSGSTTCAYNVPCGTFHTGHKKSDPPSQGTIFTDNILARIDGDQPDFAGGVENFNLFTSTKGWGVHDVLDQPVYVGGDRPTTYEGFELAAGSPGKGTASDGTDRGARIRGEVGAGSPRLPATSSALPPRVSVRSSLRSIVKTGKLRLAVRMPAGGTAMLRTTIRPGKALRRQRGRHSRRRVELPVARRAFKPARTRIVTISVPRALRRDLNRSRDAALAVRTYLGSKRSKQFLGAQALRIKRSGR